MRLLLFVLGSRSGAHRRNWRLWYSTAWIRLVLIDGNLIREGLAAPVNLRVISWKRIRELNWRHDIWRLLFANRIVSHLTRTRNTGFCDLALILENGLWFLDRFLLIFLRLLKWRYKLWSFHRAWRKDLRVPRWSYYLFFEYVLHLLLLHLVARRCLLPAAVFEREQVVLCLGYHFVAVLG